MWDLRQNHGDEDQCATGQFPEGHGFLKNQPAAEGGDDALQTHDDRCGGGFDSLLTQHLQGIGDTHRKNACIADWQPAGEDIGYLGSFFSEHKYTGHYRHHKALDAVEAQSVDIRAKPVDQCDLHRKGQCAAKKQKIAGADGRNAHTAE